MPEGNVQAAQRVGQALELRVAPMNEMHCKRCSRPIIASHPICPECEETIRRFRDAQRALAAADRDRRLGARKRGRP